jgi:hypothetical protein
VAVSVPNAYVVVPVSVRAKVRGQAYRAAGTLVFTLHEAGSGWMIASQSWSKDSENIDPNK